MQKNKKHYGCIILIGMAGSGKTTIGCELANTIGWAFVDTDKLIEALYATNLKKITDALDREDFLNLEANTICQLRAERCVIATGGSAIYRERAMQHLANLGTIIFLKTNLPEIEKRLALNPDRGLVIEDNQTLSDLYKERDILYHKYADLICDTSNETPANCVSWIVDRLSICRE